MATYTVRNSAGSTVASIPVATVTGSQFPINLVGQGVSSYGEIIATTQFRLMENFSNNTAPVNPVEGMVWYDSGNTVLRFYDGSQFVALGGPTTNGAASFDMLPGASNVDLTTTGKTAIFTAPATSDVHHATGILFKVTGTPTATTPAFLNVLVSTSEDVMETTSVTLDSANQHAFYVIQGKTRSVSNTETIQLEVSTGATGGNLNVEVHLFGLRT